MKVPITNTSPYSLPQYATPGSAGADLRAHLEGPLEIGPMERALVPTGLRIGLPEGYEAQVRPRSGLAARQGITLLNAPGTIDCDYRGEIKILLVNLSATPQVIQPGDRIAQLVVAPFTRVDWVPSGDLGETDRSEGGFGSTGKQ